jgi:hypothetical protein
VCIAENSTVNVVSGTGSIALIGGNASAATVSGNGNTVIAGGGTYSGAGNLILGQPNLDNGLSGNGNIAIGAGHGLSGNGSIALRSNGSSLTSANSRGMSSVELRTTSEGTGVGYPIRQAIRQIYSFSTNTLDAGTWKTATTNRLVAGTTNIYSKVACVFSGFICVRSNQFQRYFKIEGVVTQTDILTQTVTFLAGSSDPDMGEAQVVLSGSYLLFQARHGATAPIGVGTGLGNFTIDAIIDFYEL